MRRTRLTATLVALAASTTIFAGIALAADINGTAASENLRGTDNPDTINGNGGKDRIRGFAGDDVLTGGNGRDRIFAGLGNDTVTGADHKDRLHGGEGNDTIEGGNGRDLISGGRGDDTLRGGDGDDRIFANQGADESFGGDGDDRIWALSRYDVTGADDTAGDKLHGGNGDDTFRTRDGEPDTIDCGDGNDRVFADFKDVADPSCEQVKRKAPRSRDDRDENRTQSPKEDRKDSKSGGHHKRR